MAEYRDLIEGILLAALALTILTRRRRIADYLVRRIEMKRRDALSERALELKREYKGARAVEDWREAERIRREYQRVTHMIAEIDRDMKAKEKAPGDVAASTESTPNKTSQVYHKGTEESR